MPAKSVVVRGKIRRSPLLYGERYRNSHHCGDAARSNQSNDSFRRIRVLNAAAGSRPRLTNIAKTLIFRAPNAIAIGAHARRKNQIRGIGNCKNGANAIRNPQNPEAPERCGSAVWHGRKSRCRVGNPASKAGAEPIRDPRSNNGCKVSRQGLIRSPGVAKWPLEFSGLKSAACGSPPRRAYPP
jgi:hypothetical protein